MYLLGKMHQVSSDVARLLAPGGARNVKMKNSIEMTSGSRFDFPIPRRTSRFPGGKMRGSDNRNQEQPASATLDFT